MLGPKYSVLYVFGNSSDNSHYICVSPNHMRFFLYTIIGIILPFKSIEKTNSEMPFLEQNWYFLIYLLTWSSKVSNYFESPTLDLDGYWVVVQITQIFFVKEKIKLFCCFDPCSWAGVKLDWLGLGIFPQKLTACHKNIVISLYTVCKTF